MTRERTDITAGCSTKKECLLMLRQGGRMRNRKILLRKVMAEITSEGHTGSSDKKEGERQSYCTGKAHKNLGVSDTHAKLHLGKQKQFSTTLGSIGRRIGLCQIS